MRVAVTGATGNVGSALIRALHDAAGISEVIGIARRVDGLASTDKVSYVSADVRDAGLADLFAGVDAVVHLAWAIQPGRDRRLTRSINVDGTRHVLDAAAAAGVKAIVHASSVGAYSAHPEQARVDEQWETGGIDSSFYSVDKAAAERLLDEFERAHPAVRVVRLRPGLIFQRSAAAEIRRLFLGPLFPRVAMSRALLPVLPNVNGVRFQAVHADDVAVAYRNALLGQARGAFNIAAEPVLDLTTVARLLDSRPVSVPFRPVRLLADLTWRARLQPTQPGWLDIAAKAPLMDTSRAHRVLGWQPRYSGTHALGELMRGLRSGDGGDTPPLETTAGGPLRVGEFASGIGSR